MSTLTRNKERGAQTRKVILEAVQAKGPITVAELQEVTGLSTRTIQEHLRALREDGLVGLGWAPITKARKRA